MEKIRVWPILSNLNSVKRSRKYKNYSSQSERRRRKHQKRLELLKRRQRRRRGRLFQSSPSILLAISVAVFVFITIIAILGEAWFLPTSQVDWCNIDKSLYPSEYKNPDHDSDPCMYYRTIYLLLLTRDECEFLRRLILSVLFGGVIGYERRASDRPAGIRTMGLVSLGSCSFTLSSIGAFKSSTMGWDASRVTAAIPSGVGFLGAGLIWKGKIGSGENEVHQVHGLTTAASLWLSAAVGAGSGGGLYFVTSYAVVLVLAVLRFGPKIMSDDDDEEEEEEEEGGDDYNKIISNFADQNDHDPVTISRCIRSSNDLIGMEEVTSRDIEDIRFDRKYPHARSKVELTETETKSPRKKKPQTTFHN